MPLEPPPVRVLHDLEPGPRVEDGRVHVADLIPDLEARDEGADREHPNADDRRVLEDGRIPERPDAGLCEQLGGEDRESGTATTTIHGVRRRHGRSSARQGAGDLGEQRVPAVW
jgi:hypothetical protein